MNVLDWFIEISKIPRESGHEELISNYIMNFARERNLEAHKDKFNNVLIKKQAHDNYKDLPGIILQAHMDMVCVKKKESDHDFRKDSIKIIRDEKFIRARDTSLGADNGIGMAVMLSVLDNKNLEHAELEALFSTEEETGMAGAKNFDLEKLNGKILINLDNSEFGELCVGCAGTLNLKNYLDVKLIENNLEDKFCFDLRISGLLSGHSGSDINQERANGIILMARLLLELNKKFKINLCDISGGTRTNAIPNECEIKFSINKKNISLLEKIIFDFEKRLKLEFADVEKNIKFELNKSKINNKFSREITQESLKELIKCILLMPNGVIRTSIDFKNLVDTSSNLAVINKLDDKIFMFMLVRSMDDLRKEFVKQKINLLFAHESEIISEGPTWNYNKDSRLIEIVSRIYKNKFKKDMKVFITHAGLECGYFANKIKNIISIGADIFEMHTVHERCEINSVIKLFDFVCEIIKNNELKNI